MLPPEPTPTRNWKKPLLWTIAVVLLLGLALAALPGYRALKTRRAHKITAEAETLLAQQRWEEAFQKAQSALQLRPQDPRSLLVVARILGHFGREEALDCWSTLFAKRKPTGPELLEVTTLALQLKRLDVAGEYLPLALQQKPVAPETFHLAALFCEAKGDPPQAIQFARTWLASQPRDLEIRVLLCRQLLATRQPPAAQEAKALLWEIARINHPLSAKGLGVLSYLPDLSRDELKECLQRVSAFPGEDLMRDTVIRDLQLRLDPQRRSEIIAAAIKQDQKIGGARLIGLARWLSQRGEFKSVLEAIPPHALLANKDLFLVASDAMASLGRWSQLETLLAREPLPLEPVLVQLYRARVAGELKQDRAAETHWAQVQWLAATNTAALRYVAEYAEKLGESGEAAKAWRKLVRDPKSARSAYLALVRLANQKGDTAELRRLMQELVTLYPKDPAPQGDLAYLQLLARENLASARSVAKDLHQKNPDTVAYRTTLALAHLRHNDIAAAKALCQEAKVDWSSVAPALRAVYVAVLGASGDKVAARELARAIPANQLKAEERALVEPWF